MRIKYNHLLFTKQTLSVYNATLGYADYECKICK